METIISDKAIEEVMTRIDVLAQKLGVTAEYLFGVYVKQAYINSVVGICGITIVFILLLSTIPVGIWLCKRIKEKKMSGDWHTAWATPMGVLAFVFLIFLAFGLNDIVSGFANPEHYAFSKILSAIK